MLAEPLGRISSLSFARITQGQGVSLGLAWIGTSRAKPVIAERRSCTDSKSVRQSQRSCSIFRVRLVDANKVKGTPLALSAGGSAGRPRWFCGWVAGRIESRFALPRRGSARGAGLRRTFVRVGLGLVILFSGPACQPTPSTAPVSVEGQVFLNGQPLLNGVIVFVPNRERGTFGTVVRQSLDIQGRYRIPATSPNPLRPGWYLIALAQPPNLNLAQSGYPEFPAALRRPDLSGIERQIPAQPEVPLDFLIQVNNP